MELPRRPDHGQQPDGRPSRLGPRLQGPLPALPRDARRGRALPERLRLPGPVGRGQRRARPRVHLQARHRGVRDRRVRHALQAARPDLCRAPDRAVGPARDVDGLERSARAAPAGRHARRGPVRGHDDRGPAGSRHRHRRDARRAARDARHRRQLLHVQQREQRPDLGVPRRVPPAGLDLQGPRHDAVVRPLRHGHLADGDERGLPGPRRPRSDGPLPAARPARREPARLDDDALDADLERGGGRRSVAPLRPGPTGRRDVLARQGHAQDGARGPVRGGRGGRRDRPGRLALRGAVRRAGCGPDRVRGRPGRPGGHAVRASGGAVDGGRGRRGDGHRPHRPRLRRGGLPARQVARPAGRRAARRERHLPRRLRGAVRARRAQT